MATSAISTNPTVLAVRDPARGSVIEELPIDDVESVAAAVARARAAQPAWGAPLAEGARRMLKRARREMVKVRGDIIDRSSARPGRRVSTSPAS
jgi:acyl-CoA reductase-like NAD-dependent aldehyde dehydrogenase